MAGEDYSQLLDEVYREGYEFEAGYGYCPQAVLAAIQKYFGIIDDRVFKASQALAGGGALCGDGSCGGLAGGMLAVSTCFGRSGRDLDGGDRRQWIKSTKMAGRLRQRFFEEFGSVICSAVQVKIMGRSFDLRDRSDYQKFEEAGGHRDKCPDVTGKVARWTAEILLEEGVSLSYGKRGLYRD